MSENKPDLKLQDLGESKIIELIEQIIFEKTGEQIKIDDAFFIDLNIQKESPHTQIVLNTDMLISTFDAPPQMSSYQIGYKSIVMNVSDLLVKGITPIAVIISLGLPNSLLIKKFRDIIEGIAEACKFFDMSYIGGDLNEIEKEIIINPTVIGFVQKEAIIFRKGMKVGDVLCVNGNFGLTGVGFNILLNQIGNETNPKYKKAIDSVLNPTVQAIEGKLLAENNLATSSIDSSDGLAKSLKDLSIANENLGFEVDFHQIPVNEVVKDYSENYNVPLHKLLFNGGEEFVHIFTINPKNLDKAIKLIADNKGSLIPIGRVIAENEIFIIKDNEREILQEFGYEHFLTTRKK